MSTLLAELLERERERNEILETERQLRNPGTPGRQLIDLVKELGGTYNEQFNVLELKGVRFVASTIDWDPDSRLSLREMRLVLNTVPGFQSDGGRWVTPEGGRPKGIREAYAVLMGYTCRTLTKYDWLRTV